MSYEILLLRKKFLRMRIQTVFDIVIIIIIIIIIDIVEKILDFNNQKKEQDY